MRLKIIIHSVTALFLTGTMMLSCDAKETLGTPDSGTANDGLEVDTTANLPIADLNTLVGNTYLVDFLPGYWRTPRNVGQEIGEYVPGLLFQILAVDVTTNRFDAILTTANEDGTQNPCAKTATMTGTITDNIAFTTDPMDFVAFLTGPDKTTVAPIHGLALSGSFIDQGASFNHGVLDALMDFRDVACIFTLIEENDRTAETICIRMTDLSYTCETCPFDPAVSQCVTMKAELFKAQAVDIDIVPVTDFDRTCYPDQSCLL